jgi:uncharacterized membrane protein YraQ (UPF0718 family)
MLAVSILALVAVLLGGLLGLRRLSEVVLGPLRAFALVSVSAVILLQLLPEAIAAGGAVVLFAALLAFAFPAIWPRLRRKREPAAQKMTLEVAYISLLVHKVSDGLGLGVIVGHDHGLAAHWELALALSAHTIPMAAIVAISFRDRGPVHMWLRVLGLGGAMLLGIALSDIIVEGPLPSIRPFFDAMASGLLLHIIFHDIPRPKTRPTSLRLAEMLAIVAGLAVAFAGLHDHEEHGHAESDVVHSLTRVLLTFAPGLALALVLAALAFTYFGSAPVAPLRNSGFGPRLRAALFGLSLPLCSCVATPVARSLERRAIALPAVLAFLLAGPELHPDTFLLTAQGFGWPLALLRLLAALALALVVGLIASRLVAGTSPPKTASNRLSPAPRPAASHAAIRRIDFAKHADLDHDDLLEVPTGPRLAHFAKTLLDLVEHSAPWLLVNLIAAAYLDALVPAGSLSTLTPGLDALITLALAVLSYVCASASTPAAAVLVMKGLDPALALAGLLIGPLTNRETRSFLVERLGFRKTALLVSLTTLCALGLSLVATALTGAPASLPTPSALQYLGATSLGVFVLLSLWRAGLARWLEALHGHHDHAHPHHHTHDALDALEAQRDPREQAASH